MAEQGKMRRLSLIVRLPIWRITTRVAVTLRKVEKKQAVWTPPPTNLYKINIDGAVFTALGAAGAGVHLRWDW